MYIKIVSRTTNKNARLGLLFLTPYSIGVWVGLETKALAVLLPNSAMSAFVQLLWGS